MCWLVETNLATARQPDGRFHPPRRLSNLCAVDVLGFQQLDERPQVVAHQIEHEPKEVMPLVLLHEVTIGGVDRSFGGGQREYQPTLTKIDSTKSQNIAEEHPISFRILAVNEEVSPGNHEASLSTRRARGNTQRRSLG